METVSAQSALGTGSGVGRQLERMAWEAMRLARRSTRHVGIAGWCVFVLVSAGGLASVAEHRLNRQAADLAALLAQPAAPRPLVGLGQPEFQPSGRARLDAFERHLLPHEDIPVALQDLLGLIEKEGLVAVQGVYRAQAEPVGGFLRYHMNIPVKGSAVAVQRFIQAALRSQQTLVLQSVQFKRERSESGEIEARIQWVLLTRLPGGAR